MTTGRQLGVLLAAFAGGAALAAVFGAGNFGIALGIGQLCFAAALVYLLLRSSRTTSGQGGGYRSASRSSASRRSN